jgi:hypothetical protein
MNRICDSKARSLGSDRAVNPVHPVGSLLFVCFVLRPNVPALKKETCKYRTQYSVVWRKSRLRRATRTWLLRYKP